VNVRTVPVAREVNDSMPGYTFDLIAAELARQNRPLAGARVAVLGVAFKNDTGDLRATPTQPVVAALREAGAEVSIFDPLADPDDAEKTFGLAPAGSLADAVQGADCLAVLAWHRAFNEIDFTELRRRVASPCVLIDGRAYFTRDRIEQLRRSGFIYRGIGR
jgi:UDP-N-acetyl-D-mannosaminuronic acid dehydrogenase